LRAEQGKACVNGYNFSQACTNSVFEDSWVQDSYRKACFPPTRLDLQRSSRNSITVNEKRGACAAPEKRAIRMNRITRRRFLATSTMCVAATQLRAQSAAHATLTIPSEAVGPHIPEDFIGLSYEVQQLVDPTFFSGQNTGLIQAFKALSAPGVLRLGGNTSEFEWWKPTPQSPEPEHPQTREEPGEPKAQYYPVTAEAVRNLAAFLQATGWSCLYGIGMGTNTPKHAA